MNKELTGMNPTDRKTPSTEICGCDADSITLRGRDLVADVIGSYSLTGAFLLQALGEEPTERQCELLDAVMVTIMEHGLMPSVISTRLTLSGAPESLQGAVAAGLLGVGDRYGGTAGKCGELGERLVRSHDIHATAKEIVAEHRLRKEPVPGFGHPIHSGRDPRVDKLLEMLPEGSDAMAAMRALEAALSESLGKTLVMNVSAALAALMMEAKIPATIMRGVVLIARTAGLVGHALEEMQNPVGDDLWQAAQSAVPYRE
ncbi:MAG: citryl-CoA lyase [Gammaproteobacteria bacterium]